MNTVEVKTANLIGLALDWAVAKTVGVDVKANKIDGLWHLSAEVLVWDIPNYSTNWAQCGPLRDRYRVSVWDAEKGVMATVRDNPRFWIDETDRDADATADTATVAICRAIVLRELGYTVMVPAELINGDEK